VNAKLYVETVARTCSGLQICFPSGFIFLQDGVPAHMAKLAQDWTASKCSEFIGKDEWPANY